LPEEGVAAVPLATPAPLRVGGIATVPAELRPLATNESSLTDERIIDADTAAIARIVCRSLVPHHPISCSKPHGLMGQVIAKDTATTSNGARS
jgi:hypothetical protein